MKKLDQLERVELDAFDAAVRAATLAALAYGEFVHALDKGNSFAAREHLVDARKQAFYAWLQYETAALSTRSRASRAYYKTRASNNRAAGEVYARGLDVLDTAIRAEIAAW